MAGSGDGRQWTVVRVMAPRVVGGGDGGGLWTTGEVAGDGGTQAGSPEVVIVMNGMGCDEPVPCIAICCAWACISMSVPACSCHGQCLKLQL